MAGVSVYVSAWRKLHTFVKCPTLTGQTSEKRDTCCTCLCFLFYCKWRRTQSWVSVLCGTCRLLVRPLLANRIRWEVESIKEQPSVCKIKDWVLELLLAFWFEHCHNQPSLLYTFLRLTSTFLTRICGFVSAFDVTVPQQAKSLAAVNPSARVPDEDTSLAKSVLDRADPVQFEGDTMVP